MGFDDKCDEDFAGNFHDVDNDFETMNVFFKVKWCTLKCLHADVCFVRKVRVRVSVDI